MSAQPAPAAATAQEAAVRCPEHPGVVMRRRPDPMGPGDLGCRACDEEDDIARIEALIPRANDIYGL